MALSQLHIGRRGFLGGTAALLAWWPATTTLARNPTGERLHGLSPFGALKYPADWTHFDWVRLDAPQGGTFAFTPPSWFFNQNHQTFDTLQSFTLRGTAPPRMEVCYSALMVAAADTPGEVYGELAEWVEISADRNTYTFRLREGPRFGDGAPVTAEDVAWSVNTLRTEGHPSFELPARDLAEAVADDARTVRLVFNGEQSDRAVLAITTWPVLQRAWFEARAAQGLAFDAATLEQPPGSGPWRVARAVPGTVIEYERVPDWWGADMPFGRGLWNFERWRIEFFRERTAAFEAFKKGVVRYREEFTSKTWATEYDFPAVEDGRVVKKLFPAEPTTNMQGWALNTRRPQFADAATREAIGLAFDFEWTNRNFFFEAYTRADSLFELSPFKAEGEPAGAELALLDPLRDRVPAAVFGEPLMQPRSDGTGRDRAMLRRALELLTDAGWERRGGKLFRDGRPLDVEFLIRSPTFERILGKFVGNLNALGANASIRLVDAAQFQRRLDTYDFDAVGRRQTLGPLPTGEGLRQLFGSAAAKVDGSPNLPGLQDPAVDSLLQAVAAAKSEEELTVAMRALDRVLRALHVWLPNWYGATHRVAYWTDYGYPEPKPLYAFPVEAYWHTAEGTAAGAGSDG